MRDLTDRRAAAFDGFGLIDEIFRLTFTVSTRMLLISVRHRTAALSYAPYSISAGNTRTHQLPLKRQSSRFTIENSLFFSTMVQTYFTFSYDLN